jgi:hypothetical protein
MTDADNYKIKIKDLALFVRNVQLSPAVRMGHVKALEKTSCKYPIRLVKVKVATVPRGNMNYVQDNMFLGQLPKRLVIGCMDSDALNGTITKIPFDFRHYKINFVALNVDGQQIPAKRYNPTLKTEVIFAVIWDSIPVRERCIKTKEIPSPERNTLKETSYLDSSEVGTFQLIKQANLRVEIHFAEALAGAINVVLYAEFDNVIEIGRDRQVLFDYSA